MNPDTADQRKHLLRAASWSAVLAAVLLVATGLIVRGVSDSERLLTSLQWFDVTVVQILAALPLAWWCGVWSGPLRKTSRMLVVMAAFVTVAILATVGATIPLGSWVVESAVLSAVMILAAALSAILGVGSLDHPARVAFAPLTAASMLVVAFLVPATYLHARLRHAERELTELIDQSRFGEALATAQPIARLEPTLVVNGRPIREVVSALTKGVVALESQVSGPFPGDATDEIRLTRARGLAILGRTDEALAVLRDCQPGLDAFLLEGTIRETRGEWTVGREKYAAARMLADALPLSPTRTRRQIQALKGVAYCERKAGRTREAEAAYLELLALSPTADAHFLAAQFYDDSQSTALALKHARQAVALDPQRYSESGRKLIDKLQTVHFGCWGVYAEQRGGR